MGANDDVRFERAALTGNVDLPLVTFPVARGIVRRSEPDGTHAEPYFNGLTGTSLTIELGGFGFAPAPFTINFVSDNYADAVAAVNAVSPGDFLWLESEGVATIRSVHSGDNSYIKITGGTSASIFGMTVDPLPGSISIAGDVDSAVANRRQQNPGTTKALSYDEDLTTSHINRAIIGSLAGTDKKLWDLDREIIQYKVFTAEQSGAGLDTIKISDVTAADYRISIDAALASMAEEGDLGQAIAVLTQSTPPRALYNSSNDRVVATFISYGDPGNSSPNTGYGTIPWGSPGGYDLSVSQAPTSEKHSAIAIDLIAAGVVRCPGASFVTNRVQPRDQVVISGATNTIPFSHNGAFMVVAVLGEELLALRPLGSNEVNYFSGTEVTPQQLNQFLPFGTVYGSVTVYLGRFVTMTGPSGASDDTIFLKVSNPIGAAAPCSVRIPVATTLREALISSFLQNQSTRRDDGVAYLYEPNDFTKTNTFDKDIGIGSGLANVDAFTGRVRGDITPADNGTDSTLKLVLIEEWIDPDGIGKRLYANAKTSVGNNDWRFTVNASWDGAVWTADDTSKNSFSYILGTTFKAWMRTAAGGTFAESAWDSSMPFDLPSIVSAPAAPDAAVGRLFVRSNGLTTPNETTQLCIRFHFGVVVVIVESDPF